MPAENERLVRPRKTTPEAISITSDAPILASCKIDQLMCRPRMISGLGLVLYLEIALFVIDLKKALNHSARALRVVMTTST